MYSIFVIALNTFKEAIRNRILYVILLFAILIIISGGIMGDLSVSAPEDLIRSIGLFGINFFSIMIAVFIGIGLVYNEIDKKTIYTIVSKPIDRTHFILGKYFGLLLTIYANVIIMTLFFLMAIHYYSVVDQQTMNDYFMHLASQKGSYTQADIYMYYVKALLGAIPKGAGSFFGHDPTEATKNIMTVISMNCFELAIIVAFAILFSSFSTPILSAFMTIMTFLVGRGNEDIIRYVWKLQDKIQASGGADMTLHFKAALAQVIALIAPNLSIFYKVSDAIYEDKAPIYGSEILYGVIYPAAVLTLACLIFSRRNFK
ncbi:hypothetical protein JXA32_10905 [Candidatus Sumerlaeota bacterium]|nr:hypothetical protein [Candidatus Sumerlaeota bacterium]